MGFWIATSDTSGNRIANSELLLQPGPSRIDYPDGAAGSILDTSAGAVIHQQPSVDGRRRSWVWVGYPAEQAGYLRIWPTLTALRSRYRADAGLSPYVYVKEDITGGLQRRLEIAGASGSGSAYTFTDGTASWTTNALRGGAVIVAGQTRAILANTGTTLTVGDAFLGSPSGAYTILYTASDWFRVRVLEVDRKPNDDGRQMRYAESRMTFTVDDPNSLDLVL